MKSANDFILNLWSNMVFTPLGRIVASFEQDETATRLMMVGNLLMIQETGIIIGAQQTFLQRDMFKEEMGCLSLTRDKLKWSQGSLHTPRLCFYNEFIYQVFHLMTLQLLGYSEVGELLLTLLGLMEAIKLSGRKINQWKDQIRPKEAQWKSGNYSRVTKVFFPRWRIICLRLIMLWS
jgi:hypothetical protein